MSHDMLLLSFLYQQNHILDPSPHITRTEIQTQGTDHYKNGQP